MKQEPKRDYFALSIIIWVLCLIMAGTDLFFNHCERRVAQSGNSANTTLQAENNLITKRLKPRKQRTDSALSIIPKAQKAAQKYYDTIPYYMPDTCKSYLSNYKLFRDSTENILLFVVASQDSTIKDQDTVIQNQARMLENDKAILRDTVIYLHRWGIRRGRKGFGIGFATGYGVREVGGAIKNLKL